MRYSQFKDGICINVIEWDPAIAPDIQWPDGVTVSEWKLEDEALRPVAVSQPETLPDSLKVLIRAEIMTSAELKQVIIDEIAKQKALPL